MYEKEHEIKNRIADQIEHEKQNQIADQTEQEPSGVGGQDRFYGTYRGSDGEKYRKKWFNINVLFIIVNSVIWLVMSIQGDTQDTAYMLAHGAMYPPYVLSGEWYRLFSSMFLHFGAEHLIGNMFMQYFLGDMLLRAVSQWRFAVIYLFSGVGGSILSLLVMLLAGDYYVSAGASGAVYGIIGALFWVVLRNGGKFESISIPRMLLAVALYISYGFTVEGVDAWAHLGGALTGFVLCIVVYRKKKYR